MKTSFLSAAFVGAILMLPSALQAQAPRPRYPGPPAYGGPQVSSALYEVQCLETTLRTLYNSYAAYCKQAKIQGPTPDGRLMRALMDLNQDVTRLAAQVRAHAQNRATHLGPAYRAFHLSEYSLQDSEWMAEEAGYIRSMSPYFQDIDQHLTEIGRLGYRNPQGRRGRTTDNQYPGRYPAVQERPFALPPVPSVPMGQVPPTVPAPLPPRDRDRDRDEKPDLGDLLKDLLRRKL